MAEKQNPGFMEQIREMRALRTQQLRGMTADQRFYANMNSNQRALVQANQKLAASFDSMSKTFVSSFRGLASAVGSIASKGVSAAGSVAGGATSLAGSIASGLGKVLPLAITGIVAKMLLWDNLTGENKNRILSSVSTLFSNIFGGLPDLFRGILQKVVKSISEMDIKFPILTTLMQKTEAFVKIITAGFELAKLKFEDLMDFFEDIKDPMKIFESGLKAMGAATLSRLLLPATISLVTSIIGNRLLMGQIGDALDSKGVGGGRGRGGGTVIGPAGRSNRPRKPGTGTGGGIKAGVGLAARMGLKAGSTTLALAIPVFNILALSYTAYELYQIAKELGLTDEEAGELSQYEETGQTKATAFLPTNTAAENFEYEKLIEQRNINADVLAKMTGTSASEQITKANLIKKQEELSKKINVIAEKSRINKDLEEAGQRKEVFDTFYSIWDVLERDEKLYAIEKGFPVLETEKFVYFMGKDGKTIERKSIEQYLKELRSLPEIEQQQVNDFNSKMSSEEFKQRLAGVIKPGESGKKGYNAVFGEGKMYGSILPNKNITEMTGQEVLDFQVRLRNATEGKLPGQPADVGTSAVGAYQIVRSNLTNKKGEGYYDRYPEELSKPFDAEQQDKIYRFLIKGAVDDFVIDEDKQKFKSKIYNLWEVFKRDTPDGNKARTELDALLNNKVFTETATDSTKSQSKEQRAARSKILTEMLGQGFKDLFKPGDTTLATIKGESAVDIGIKKVENVAENVTDKLRGIFKGSATVEEFLGRSQGPGFEDILKMFAPASNKPAVTIINNDNKSSSSSYTGSAGASMDSSIISKAPYDKYTAFNSLAGGMPQT